jgi:tetratricopeptide (TPR) repeat protein
LGTDLKFWELGGFFQEGRRWLQRTLEGTQESVSIQRAQALLAAAELSSAISDFDYGLQCVRQAQQLFQQLGDQRGEIDARLMVCDLARYAGKLAHLQTQIEEALQMAEQMSYTAGMAKGKQLLAINIVYTTGEIEAAIQYDLGITLRRAAHSPPFGPAARICLLI